jgi:hypothetical protein
VEGNAEKNSCEIENGRLRKKGKRGGNGVGKLLVYRKE